MPAIVRRLLARPRPRSIESGRARPTKPRSRSRRQTIPTQCSSGVYRYRETASNATWTLLGGIGQENDKTYGMTWVFQVRPDWPDRPKAYIISRRGFMFEFDLTTGRATQLGNLWQLEPGLAGQELYGNTSWDNNGRFYFSAFPKLPTDPGRAKLVALDPTVYLPAIR